MNTTPRTDAAVENGYRFTKKDGVSEYVPADEMRKIERELADLQQSFELMYAADIRAIKAWQAANRGNDMVWPDRCGLVTWLLENLAQLRGQISFFREQYESYKKAYADASLTMWAADHARDEMRKVLLRAVASVACGSESDDGTLIDAEWYADAERVLAMPSGISPELRELRQDRERLEHLFAHARVILFWPDDRYPTEWQPSVGKGPMGTHREELDKHRAAIDAARKEVRT